jgi:hypothetical protein
MAHGIEHPKYYLLLCSCRDQPSIFDTSGCFATTLSSLLTSLSSYILSSTVVILPHQSQRRISDMKSEAYLRFPQINEMIQRLHKYVETTATSGRPLPAKASAAATTSKTVPVACIPPTGTWSTFSFGVKIARDISHVLGLFSESAEIFFGPCISDMTSRFKAIGVSGLVAL